MEIAKAFQDDMASENEQHRNGANGQLERRAIPRDLVFLLDDDASVLKSTDRLLRAAGLEVKAFNDPHAFLQDAERVRPRVAVIDIWMPVMDGLEVQKRAQQCAAPETRVIVLTSNDDSAVRIKAMNGGASAFFLKPPNDDDFVNHIEAELNGA